MERVVRQSLVHSSMICCWMNTYWRKRALMRNRLLLKRNTRIATLSIFINSEVKTLQELMHHQVGKLMKDPKHPIPYTDKTATPQVMLKQNQSTLQIRNSKYLQRKSRKEARGRCLEVLVLGVCRRSKMIVKGLG